jgi:hypothetical protein
MTGSGLSKQFIQAQGRAGWHVSGVARGMVTCRLRTSRLASIHRRRRNNHAQGTPMTDREKIVAALREKPLKIFDVMKRVNIRNQEDCQSLLLKMRDEGLVRFDIHKGVWLIG